MVKHMGLTREQAEFVGNRRRHLAKVVQRMVKYELENVTEEPKRIVNKKDSYYRKLASQAIGRPLTRIEEVHIITRLPGIDDAEVCVPMADAYHHKRIDSFRKTGGYINQLSNGAFVIQNHPLKCIVDVFKQAKGGLIG